MPTLLSNGSTAVIHAAPDCAGCASGGVGKTIFSSGRLGGRNRAGRWNASRLMPLLGVAGGGPPPPPEPRTVPPAPPRPPPLPPPAPNPPPPPPCRPPPR